MRGHWNPPTKSRQLVVRARQGSAAARDQLLRDHMPLVLHIAKHYVRPGAFLEMGDLIQQGCLGLLHALTKYDAQHISRGRRVTFGTYAHYWINHFIRREIENHGRTVSIPVHRIQEAARQGDALPVTISLDQCVNEKEAPGLRQDRLADPSDAPETWCRQWESVLWIERSLARLSSSKRRIVCHRYGVVTGTGEMTQKQVGRLLGISSSQVGVWEREALRQLRDFFRAQLP